MSNRQLPGTKEDALVVIALNADGTPISGGGGGGGGTLTITGTTSVFTYYRVLHLIRLQTAALASPITVTPATPLRGIANSPINVYFPVSLTTGTVYINVVGFRAV